MQLQSAVEVRNRYDGRWAGGFEVVEERPSGCCLRRLSDGSVLPVEFSTDDVRVVDASARLH